MPRHNTINSIAQGEITPYVPGKFNFEFDLKFQIIAFIIAFVLIILLAKTILIKVRARARRKKFENLDKEEIRKKWLQIIGRIKNGDDDSYALALIEADKFFDDILSKRYTSALPYAKRLGMLVVDCRDLEPVWYAHKTRNKVVHDAKMVSTRSLRKSLSCYGNALKRLGLI